MPASHALQVCSIHGSGSVGAPAAGFGAEPSPADAWSAYLTTVRAVHGGSVAGTDLTGMACALVRPRCALGASSVRPRPPVDAQAPCARRSSVESEYRPRPIPSQPRPTAADADLGHGGLVSPTGRRRHQSPAPPPRGPPPLPARGNRPHARVARACARVLRCVRRILPRGAGAYGAPCTSRSDTWPPETASA